jgi:hypothetical protein
MGKKRRGKEAPQETAGKAATWDRTTAKRYQAQRQARAKLAPCPLGAVFRFSRFLERISADQRQAGQEHPTIGSGDGFSP